MTCWISKKICSSIHIRENSRNKQDGFQRTDYDEVHPHFNVAKSIYTLADKDSGVRLLGLFYPQLSALGPDPNEGVVYRLAALFPLDNRCRVAGYRTLNLDILAQPHHGLHLFLLGYRGA